MPSGAVVGCALPLDVGTAAERDEDAGPHQAAHVVLAVARRTQVGGAVQYRFHTAERAAPRPGSDRVAARACGQLGRCGQPASRPPRWRRRARTQDTGPAQRSRPVCQPGILGASGAVPVCERPSGSGPRRTALRFLCASPLLCAAGGPRAAPGRLSRGQPARRTPGRTRVTTCAARLPGASPVSRPRPRPPASPGRSTPRPAAAAASPRRPPSRRPPGPARSSARVTHIASAISPSAGRSGASASATAWKPTISERGNGQAWLPR